MSVVRDGCAAGLDGLEGNRAKSSSGEKSEEAYGDSGLADVGVGA
jgi:hypothetical protein